MILSHYVLKKKHAEIIKAKKESLLLLHAETAKRNWINFGIEVAYTLDWHIVIFQHSPYYRAGDTAERSSYLNKYFLTAESLTAISQILYEDTDRNF